MVVMDWYSNVSEFLNTPEEKCGRMNTPLKLKTCDLYNLCVFSVFSVCFQSLNAVAKVCLGLPVARVVCLFLNHYQ